MVRQVQSATVAALAIAVVYLGVGLAAFGDPTHRVELELPDDATSWPWHSSIQRSSAAWVNSPDGQQWAGDSQVEALAPVNIENLVVVARNTDAAVAEDAAGDTVDAFLVHDVDLQTEPVELRRVALQSEIETLRQEFAVQEEFVGRSANESQIIARSTRLEGTAALLGKFETELGEVEAELAQIAPRYEILESQPVSPLRERLPETLKLFGGIFILGLLVQTFRPQTFQTNADAGSL